MLPLQLGLHWHVKMKLSKGVGHMLPAPTEMQRQGRVGSEHGKVRAAPVCSVHRNQSCKDYIFDDQEGAALCKVIFTFLSLV